MSIFPVVIPRDEVTSFPVGSQGTHAGFFLRHCGYARRHLFFLRFGALTTRFFVGD